MRYVLATAGLSLTCLYYGRCSRFFNRSCASYKFSMTTFFAIKSSNVAISHLSFFSSFVTLNSFNKMKFKDPSLSCCFLVLFLATSFYDLTELKYILFWRRRFELVEPCFSICIGDLLSWEWNDDQVLDNSTMQLSNHSLDCWVRNWGSYPKTANGFIKRSRGAESALTVE